MNSKSTWALALALLVSIPFSSVGADSPATNSAATGGTNISGANTNSAGTNSSTRSRSGRNTGTNASPTSGSSTNEAAAPDDDEQLRTEERANQRLRARLTRGPYLQLGTHDSVVVRWRTDQPSPTVVRFGLSATNLQFTNRAAGALTEHLVTLTNLRPDTRYYYAFSTNTLSMTNTPPTTNTARRGGGGGGGFGGGGGGGGGFGGGGTNIFSNVILEVGTNSFVTAPLPGTPKPTRVWVLGDSGTRSPVQKAVRDAFVKWNGDRAIDLWLMLGDNAYTTGRDTEYQGGIFLAYPEQLRTSVLWPTLGNHDGGSADSRTQSGPYYEIFSLPTMGQAGGVMSGTEAYYSFDYANIHFICLDSHDSDRSTNGLMIRWLKADLAANQQPWTIAYWHHPVYSKGSHDTDKEKDGDIRCREMREYILETLEAGGVDLVLSGHSHAYERSWMLNGHYGGSTNLTSAMFKSFGDGRMNGDGPYRKASTRPEPHSGTVYVVAGSSGQISGLLGLHPVMERALNVAGSLVLDVNGLRLDAIFVDSTGAKRDEFAMLKGSPPPAPGSREADVLVPLAANAAPPPRLAALLASAEAGSAPAGLTQFTRADLDFLWGRYTNSATSAAEKQLVVWALGTVGDGRVVGHFMASLTNKIRDRIITTDEENQRLAAVQALGLLAQRYDPPLELLKKGVSADWWYFRTNFVSSRPLHETAAALAACSLQALGISGRVEALQVLERALKKDTKYWVDENTAFTRELRPEFEEATNRIALATQMGAAAWRKRVLTEEIPKLKSELAPTATSAQPAAGR